MLIDLCKLRPGDLIFSLSPAWRSKMIALGTWSRYSHAMIVVYPDVWFETDGAGSGFTLIEQATCFEIQGKCAILADLPYETLSAVRVAGTAPSPSRILEIVCDHIALEYPSLTDFLPLLLPLRPFPRFSKGLVSYLSKQSKDVGGYCSQMVSQMLRDLYGISVGGQDDHISPGTLRSRVLRSGAKEVNCFQSEVPESWVKSDTLQRTYSNLVKVSAKLKAYQYPRDRASFENALAETFEQEGIGSDPSKYEIAVDQLRRILTKPRFFRLHDLVWPPKYT